jgi:hypothetical protein
MRGRQRARIFALAGAGIVGLTGMGLTAQADVGAGIGADTIRPTAKIVAGKSIALTPLYVTNTGTETATYKITIDTSGAPSKLRSVPKSWIAFKTTKLTLAPKAAAFIKGTIKVPRGTKNGRYRSYVVLSSIPETSGASTTASASAATDVVIQVGPFKPGAPA